MRGRALLVGLVGAAVLAGTGIGTAAPVPEAPDCELFGRDTHWHQPVTDLPVHMMSDTWVDAIGRDANAHPDFGSGTWEGAPIGIPYTVVDGDQPRVDVSFLYADESDPGPYPIPADPPIEGGPDGTGDRHVLIVDRDACVLYELFDAHPRDDGGWDAGSGAVFDLRSDALRPDGWTSADAAGLPILPGLVRADEVVDGVIDHAIRFTAPRTARSYVWPARHQAGRDGEGLPPMGIRIRLKADVDLSDFSPQARVVAEALKTYGAILADNGSPWFLSGTPSELFDNQDLRDLRSLVGDDFEVVDTSSWIADPDSRRVAGASQGPVPVDTAEVCDGAGSESFSDTAGTFHEDAIECVAHRAIAAGRTDGTFGPSDGLSRAQLATFLVRTLAEAGYDVPEPGEVPDAYTDDDGISHEHALNVLASVDVLPPGPTIRPGDPVERAEMARVTMRTLVVGGVERPSAEGGDRPDWFTDDDGHPDELDIDDLASLGVSVGRGGGIYGVTDRLSRGQMASFLSRALAALTA